MSDPSLPAYAQGVGVGFAIAGLLVAFGSAGGEALGVTGIGIYLLGAGVALVRERRGAADVQEGGRGE